MFGRNQYGELGLGEIEIGDFRPPTPVKWVGKEAIQQVSCGDSYSIFIFDNGQVYGMGLNLYLQLGLNHTDSKTRFFENPLNL